MLNINYNQTKFDIIPTISGITEPENIIILYLKPIANTVNIYVDGGSLNSPYYEFYLDNSGTTLLKDLELNIDHTYVFQRLNNSNSHPFYISDVGYKEKNSSAITLIGNGIFNAGIKGSESFTLSFNESFDEQKSLYYYCSSHSSMNNSFMLTNEREVLATAVADSAGNWSITTSELSEGDYSIFAQSLDSDGNSTSSDELTISIASPIAGTKDSITGQTFTLDVDGDQKVTAFGDGLMVIRKLFGSAFAGDALTAKAISSSATRSTEEIHEYIQSGVDNLMLDVDGDGKVTAFGDGLMVIRKLFGSAFAGDALTAKAISADATRDTDEIHEYISAMTTVDPIG